MKTAAASTAPALPRYAVRIWFDKRDGVYLAEAPALPGCVSHGKTHAEAAEKIAEAIELWIKDAVAAGDSVPQP